MKYLSAMNSILDREGYTGTVPLGHTVERKGTLAGLSQWRILAWSEMPQLRC